MLPEDDIPDWQEAEEDIPPGLEKKWQEREKEGMKAGVCKKCGWAFTQEDLACRHCETPTEITEGVFISLKRFFLSTPLGIMLFIMIFAALLFFLFSSFAPQQAHAESAPAAACQDEKKYISRLEDEIAQLQTQNQNLREKLEEIRSAAGDNTYRPT
jgi:uncharacterized membrane protein YvbJ